MNVNQNIMSKCVHIYMYKVFGVCGGVSLDKLLGGVIGTMLSDLKRS